jgi:hypothetical protein
MLHALVSLLKDKSMRLKNPNYILYYGKATRVTYLYISTVLVRNPAAITACYSALLEDPGARNAANPAISSEYSGDI